MTTSQSALGSEDPRAQQPGLLRSQPDRHWALHLQPVHPGEQTRRDGGPAHPANFVYMYMNPLDNAANVADGYIQRLMDYPSSSASGSSMAVTLRHCLAHCGRWKASRSPAAARRSAHTAVCAHRGRGGSVRRQGETMRKPMRSASTVGDRGEWPRLPAGRPHGTLQPRGLGRGGGGRTSAGRLIGLSPSELRRRYGSRHHPGCSNRRQPVGQNVPCGGECVPRQERPCGAHRGDVRARHGPPRRHVPHAGAGAHQLYYGRVQGRQVA